jgi:hypothetical protein
MLGQDGRRTDRGIPLLAALVAVVLVSAVGVVSLGSDLASADTVLQRGTDATLTLSDGTRRPAVEGEQIPVGTTVLAGLSGAVLATDDREVHLYPSANVTVLDGVRQVLNAGSVIVDASGASGLELDTPAAAVATRDGSLVRIDGGPLTRVGVLRTDDDGRTGADVRATDRRALTEVSEFYQVQVATGGLPGGTSPLFLTGDDYELALARDLILADRMLNQIRRRLVGTGTEGSVVLAALGTAVPDVGMVAAAAPDTERALGYLVATSASGGGSEAERFAVVRALRSAGGSWGVVAAIVGSTVDEVGARLNQLLAPSAAVLAVEQVEGSDLFRFPADPPAGTPAPVDGPVGVEPLLGPDSGAAAGRSDPPPARPKPPVPPPVDSGPVPPLPTGPLAPVVDPVLAPVTDVVADLADTVLDLLDLSEPSTAPAPAPGSTDDELLPTPTPTTTQAPLLNLRLPLLSR